MTETPLHPPRLLKLFAGFARWALWLLLALWLMFSIAWGVLHGFIVPRIGDFRWQVQTQAEKALGVPVRIGGLSAQTEGLIPSITLTDVALLDAQGREALKLPEVVVAVSPRSILRLGFEQLYVRGAHLDVRRESDGRIFIAGLAFGNSSGDNGDAADWLFSQREVAILNGSIRWTDEQRGAEPLELSDVNAVLRNSSWKHRMRIDATPPAGWGERFSLRGVFREPLWSVHSGNWQAWSGQLYAELPNGDVSRLNQYADLGALKVTEGHGAVRAWADVQRGQLVGGVADVGLSQVRATLGPKLEPLALRSVTGRFGALQLADGFEVTTKDLAFVADDGLSSPGADLYFRYNGGGASARAATAATAAQAAQEQGELRANRLDLAVIAQIAGRLPLDEKAREVLAHIAPRGLAQDVQASWQGPLSQPRQYQAVGAISDLSLGPVKHSKETAGSSAMPGLQGARVKFSLTQAGGSASLNMDSGAVVLPGVFEDPVIPVHRLGANVSWQIDGENIIVSSNNLRFGNDDAEVDAKLNWRTADAHKSSAGSRFPGVLDLSGTLTKGNGTRVHRYLPLGIPADSRHYVRDAITAGAIQQAQFRVKGDLHDFPFIKPGSGEFRIAGRVKDVNYTYVPTTLQAAGELPWPALTGLAGELIFDRASMVINNASGALAGPRKVSVRNVNAEIPDLDHAVVGVDADAHGPLADMLALVRASHITQLTDHALDQASATGNAELKLQLSLPISHIDQSKVQGSVKLLGNDVQFTPDVPMVRQALGSVQFSEGGFSLVGIQGKSLGGDVRLEGGMRVPAAAVTASSAPGAGSSAGSSPVNSKPVVQVRAQGIATADGLRSEPTLGMLAPLLQHASGSSAYTVQVGVRKGVAELLVTSPLQGMAVDLPAPLGKPAQSSVPLKVETRVLDQTGAATSADAPLQELLTVEAGEVGSVNLVRELGSKGAASRVLRGTIGVGLPAGQSLRMPSSGVEAELVLGDVDVAVWEALLKQHRTAVDAQAGADTSWQAYLPTRGSLRAQSIAWKGRSLHKVNAAVTRQKDIWLVNLDAQELSGNLEYRPESASVPAPGLIYGRFARLKLPKTSEDNVNELLADEPNDLPALDIVVQEFELHGRHLGRFEVMARNTTSSDGRREWRLSKLNLALPEATFTSSGNWAMLGSAGAPSKERRTVMNFELDVRDSGALLARFGMADVVRRGKGNMQGQVAWLGSPLSPEYSSMTGQIHVDMAAGQFLKADPGLAKLLSVLSLQSIPRRLTLDFRDVFSEGFAFDFVRGDVRIDRGVATTNNLQMKGLNAAVLMEGRADIERETQDLHVVVVPEINAMTASLVATAINPVIGLGSFLAQVFLRGPLIQAATQEFRIDGTWSDPRVERLARKKIFGGNKPSAETTSTAEAVEIAKPTQTAEPKTGATQ